jgi:Cd2+/Zn2+-exporting ATPase
MNKKTYYIKGLDCPDCAAVIEPALKGKPGFDSVELDFIRGSLQVTGTASESEVRQNLRRLGFELLERGTSVQSQSTKMLDFSGFWHYFWQMPELKLVLPGFVLLFLSLFSNRIGLHQPWVMLIQLVLLPIAGWPVFSNGFQSLFRGVGLNMNLLMSLAAIGAVIIGEAHEALIMLVLFTVSESLEGYINDKARKVLTEFADLAPKQALRVSGELEETVAVEDLRVGDEVIVRPGERFPIDGRVLSGSSEVNQAPITGESRLVPKTIGDEVLSSTVNGQGSLRVIVTRLAADNTIQRIIELVTKAQATKSKQEKFIERFARVYTPIVLAVALLVVLVPKVFFQQPFWNTSSSYGWLHRGLSLLMVGCPCALVISTPITLISALTRAAREGVIFKGGVYLENLSHANAIVFDKTGTLTQGKPAVSEYRAVDCLGPAHDETCEPCNEVLALASSLEQHSSHPLGQAVLTAAQECGLDKRYPPAESARNRDGLGQEGYINGRLATVGSLKLFQDEHSDHLPKQVVTQTLAAQSQGKTTMLVCDGERVRGFLAVEDLLRSEAPSVLKDLQTRGLQTFMLTGDNEEVARKVARLLPLNDFSADLLPEEKLKALDQLRERFGKVIMVGDGINDSPALAHADLGVAMGGAANAQVLETADLVLMNDDLARLPYALDLSRFTNQLIRQNIVISLLVKASVAVLAIMGLTPLWVAILADIGVSLAVTLNGMRAISFTPQASALSPLETA